MTEASTQQCTDPVHGDEGSSGQPIRLGGWGTRIALAIVLKLVLLAILWFAVIQPTLSRHHDASRAAVAVTKHSLHQP